MPQIWERDAVRGYAMFSSNARNLRRAKSISMANLLHCYIFCQTEIYMLLQCPKEAFRQLGGSNLSTRSYWLGCLRAYLVVFPLGHKVHCSIDGLLFILRDSHQVVKVPPQKGNAGLGWWEYQGQCIPHCTFPYPQRSTSPEKSIWPSSGISHCKHSCTITNSCLFTLLLQWFFSRLREQHRLSPCHWLQWRPHLKLCWETLSGNNAAQSEAFFYRNNPLSEAFFYRNNLLLTVKTMVQDQDSLCIVLRRWGFKLFCKGVSLTICKCLCCYIS